MNPNTETEFVSIAEIAKQNGLKVGILSSVGMNHATPAAFYAKQKTRYLYKEIAGDMAKSNFDLFAGGGIIAKTENDFNEAITNLKKNNYSILSERTAYDKSMNYGDKLYYSVFDKLASDALLYQINKKANDISLADYVEFGINYLDNPEGFFIMVEGGKIDWAAHDQDGATVINEVIDFDRALKNALDFYEKHADETLIIVTADHETGGMSFGSDEMHYDTDFLKIDNQKKSKDVFISLLEENEKSEYTKLIAQNFDFIVTENSIKNLEPKEIATKMVDSLNHISGISWTTHAHTGMPIVTYALGLGSENFSGFIDNTEIIQIIQKTAQLKKK